MSYQIEYNMDSINFAKKDIKNSFLLNLALATALVAASVGIYFCNHWLFMSLQNNRNDIVAASEQLVEEIRSGVNIPDAINTFCSELIP